IQPIHSFTIRGSFNEGFLPPYLGQLQEEAPRTNANVAPLRVKDPKRGNEAITRITLYNRGRPDLDPERCNSWSAGIVVTPTFLPALRASMDWTRIRKIDNITQLTFSQLNVSEEDLIPGLVLRGPAIAGDPFGVGRIIGFDQRYRNVLSAVSESYDFTLDSTL